MSFIQPMLAKKYYHDKTGLPKVNPKGWWVSEKFDGVRAIWNGFNKTFYSRTGRLIHAPSASFKAYLPSNVILDGELTVDERGKFKETTSIIMKKNPIEAEWDKIRYAVFDLLAYGDPQNPNNVFSMVRKEPFEERMAVLQTIFSLIPQKQTPAFPVKQYQVRDHNDVELRKKHVLQLGGEGIMLRKAGSKYCPGIRSASLLKVKDFHDADAIVTGWEYGSGKFAKALGKLNVKWVKNPSVTFKVGTGFKEKLRLGNFQKELPRGTVIVVKYFEIDNKSGRPRFPVFVGKRFEQDMK